MKSVFVSLCALLLVIFYSCNSDVPQEAPANAGADTANFTTVQWLDSNYNFGTINHGEKVHIKYTCKNTGNKPLFIYSVRPGCGCTVADYTKSAIMPGKTGEVDAEFDSNHSGSTGEVHKNIVMQTNTFNASPKLLFYGTVKATESDTAKSVVPYKSSQ